MYNKLMLNFAGCLLVAFFMLAILRVRVKKENMKELWIKVLFGKFVSGIIGIDCELLTESFFLNTFF